MPTPHYASVPEKVLLLSEDTAAAEFEYWLMIETLLSSPSESEFCENESCLRWCVLNETDLTLTFFSHFHHGLMNI